MSVKNNKTTKNTEKGNLVDNPEFINIFINKKVS